MPGHDIIVIGASRGGLHALQGVVRDLPPEIQAALFVVQHVGAHESLLPQLLGKASRLPVTHAHDAMPIVNGHIYIAPPDCHMLLERGHIHLAHGPKENFTRPAINPLFRSAAIAYGSQVVDVILSGTLDDGVAGLWEIKRRGGLAVVQDPTEAEFSSMPKSALDAVEVDYCMGTAEMSSLFARLAAEGSAQETQSYQEPESVQSAYTCPECRGPLWELTEGPIREFYCRVGHRFSLRHMTAYHEDTEERALWASVVALEEGADLARRLAAQNKSQSNRLEKEAALKEELAAQLKSGLARLQRAEME